MVFPVDFSSCARVCSGPGTVPGDVMQEAADGGNALRAHSLAVGWPRRGCAAKIHQRLEEANSEIQKQACAVYQDTEMTVYFTSCYPQSRLRCWLRGELKSSHDESKREQRAEGREPELCGTGDKFALVDDSSE